MGRGTSPDPDADIKPVAGDESAGSGEQHGERRIAIRRRWKQHAQRIALIKMVETSDAAAAAEVDFGRACSQ